MQDDAATKPGTSDVDRPHAAWWILVLGGIGLLALDAFCPPFYEWWTLNVSALPTQGLLALVFAGTVLLHIGEALYVYLLAQRIGLRESAVAWTIQTLLIGFPSTRLIRERSARAARPRAGQTGQDAAARATEGRAK